MSIIIQMVKNNEAPRAICSAQDLPLRTLIAVTIDTVNQWANRNAFQPEEAKRVSFEYLLMLQMDLNGGLFVRHRNTSGIYQINYTEDLTKNTLKIDGFVFVDFDCQCKVYGDVCGFAEYNHLDVKPVHPEMFYNYSTECDDKGNLLYPKQYNITLEPDEVDKAAAKAAQEQNQKKTKEQSEQAAVLEANE